MHTAYDLADYLLEADGQRLLAYGRGLPPEGQVMTTDSLLAGWRDHFRQLYGKRIPDRDILNELVRRGYSFVQERKPGDIHVVSATLPLHASREAKRLARQTFGLQDDQPIAWSAYFGGGAQQRNLEDVYKHDPAHEQERKAREKQREQINKQRKAQGLAELPEESPFLPDEEAFLGRSRKPARFDPRGHQQVTLGMTYQLRSNDGLHVADVDQGGPAALSGLRAGDVIVAVGPFTKSDGSYVDEFRVQTPKHFWNLVSRMEPGVPVPIKVRRGDRYAPVNHIVPSASKYRMESTSDDFDFGAPSPAAKKQWEVVCEREGLVRNEDETERVEYVTPDDEEPYVEVAEHADAPGMLTVRVIEHGDASDLVYPSDITIPAVQLRLLAKEIRRRNKSLGISESEDIPDLDADPLATPGEPPIRIPRADEVEYELTPEEEFDGPEGHFASGDEEQDRLDCQRIRDQLERGNIWAWFCAKVTAKFRVAYNVDGEEEVTEIEGTDYLGGCNYASREDFMQPGDYYDDMKQRAYDELVVNIKKWCEQHHREWVE